ncbi:MAG: hypothetical protein KH021_06315, partial [Ruminococcus sp.]|nr:hypothetical protein [Ruminococcus sp.]
VPFVFPPNKIFTPYSCLLSLTQFTFSPYLVSYIYYKKYKYFQKVQAIMNKKKSKNKKQDKQSEKPVPRKKEEEQTEGTGRNSAQNPCYGLLVCTGISYIYCLDFKNKNPGSYFNTSVSLADHY